MGTDAEKSIFISYRRTVSAGWARAIFRDLDAHGYDVLAGDGSTVKNGGIMCSTLACHKMKRY